jgi:TolB protein
LILEGTALTNPAWSPDGKRIALTVGDTTNHVVLIDADGSNMRTLVDVPFRTGTATWSPDGRQLAFADLDHGHLYVANVDGTGLRQLTRGGDYGGGDGAPAWSPAGDEIAFINDGYVVTVRPDGTDRWSDALGFDASRRWGRPAWSPDGTEIASTSGSTIWVINVGDGSAESLRPATGATDVTWSPDGRWLAFMGGGELCPPCETYDVYLMARDGTGLANLTNLAGRGAAAMPSWGVFP